MTSPSVRRRVNRFWPLVAATGFAVGSAVVSGAAPAPSISSAATAHPAAASTALTLAPNAVPTTPGPHTVDTDVRLDGRATRLRFRFWMPTGEAKSSGRLPLVVSLSPADGTALAAPSSRTADGPFAVLAPACPAGHAWSEPAAEAILGQLIDGVVADAALDADRVYLTGFGSAAVDTWRSGAAMAGRLAGIAPVDGEPTADPAATVTALWHVAVCRVTSRAGGVEPMVAALVNRPHRDFTTRMGTSGDPAIDAAAAYADPSFWGWLFAQRRSVDTSAPPPPRDPQHTHLGLPTVVKAGTPAVAVTVDLHALPTTAGYSVVPATLRLGDKTLPFDFGLYLPPGFPHAVGYHGGPIPTIVNLHWREFFGGADDQVIRETLPKLLVRAATEEKHQGERPAEPVALLHVAPVICIMPHCPADGRYERTPGMAEAVGQLIDQVVPALHADADRVFLTGVSYGGSSSWVVGERIAGRLAGIIPCDGRRTADPAATALALRDVGVYISVGDRDGEFTNDARVMVAAMTAGGHPDLTYREIHGGNHFCFSSTYTDPAFWAWLEGQRRAPASSRSSVAAALTDASTSAAPVTLAMAAAAQTQPAVVPVKPAPVAAPPQQPKPAPAPPPVAAPVKPPAVTAASAKPASPPPPAAAPAKPPVAPVAAAALPKPVPPPPPPPLPANTFPLDPASLPTTPGPHVVKVNIRMDGRPVRFRFWLDLPTGYGHGSQAWPVVMSLHNRGSIGGDGNGSITGEGLPYLLTHDRLDVRAEGAKPANPLDLKNAFPFICVAPQVPTDHLFDDPAMLTVIDQLLEAVVNDCHGDPTRTYLTGFSYGASNTWLVGSALADHFAAIAPIDGRATPDPAATVAKLAHTGVYQVVGGHDDEFMPEAKRMITALAAGPHPDFAFHEVPGGNHFCYSMVYTDPTFWTWMFAHRRVPPAEAARRRAAIVPGVTVLLDAAALPRRAGYEVVRPTVRVDGEDLSVPIGVWLPRGFPRVDAPLPVIVSLHNRYAIGMDGSPGALLGEGLPMILWRGDPNRGEHGDVPLHPVNPATDEAFIGVFPQCPSGQKWEAAPMPEVIDKVVAAVLAGYGTGEADPDRVYLTGWSYGASCTWAVATAYPQRFAAIAVNDGRAMPDPAAAVAKLRDLGVYLAFGDRDGDFTNDGGKMLDALAAARHPNFVQRVVRHGDHQSYQCVYDDPAFWGWLLAQRRHPSPRADRPSSAGNAAAVP